MQKLVFLLLTIYCGNVISTLAGHDLTDAPVDESKEDCVSTEWQCYPEDCINVQQKGYKSGVYQVRPLGTPKPYLVYCDLDTNEGGWTVLQHRFDGKVDFYRNFSEFAEGFGEITGEHWAGLETMHQLTSRRDYELLIELWDFENNKTLANYKTFSIGSREEGYKLTIKDYTGTAGDSLANHNGKKFTTIDVDSDNSVSNCAVSFKGAWWHYNCHTSNLNGVYSSGVTTEYATGMVWESFRGYYYSLKATKMLIRPTIRSTNKCDDLETMMRRMLKMSETLTTLEKQNQEIKKDLVVAQKQNQELLDRITVTSEVVPHNNLTTKYPEDCAYVAGNTSGVYLIKPAFSKEAFYVYCDLSFQNQKWTVIQNRFSGEVDFYQNYKDYQNGFGNLEGEHWLGLEKIHRIVRNGDYELYISLTDYGNQTKFAQYKIFSICGADDGYRLRIGGYIGDAGNSLNEQNNQKFTTFDKDQDDYSSNCAVTHSGAWWYNRCHKSNLNGLYKENATGNGMSWLDFHGSYKSLKNSKMLIKKKKVSQHIFSLFVL